MKDDRIVWDESAENDLRVSVDCKLSRDLVERLAEPVEEVGLDSGGRTLFYRVH